MSFHVSALVYLFLLIEAGSQAGGAGCRFPAAGEVLADKYLAFVVN
jgi:hypothetical protein